MHENGESEQAKLRSEMAELRKSFNLFVRSQASLVAALRQAEEAAQSRHRFLLSAIGSLRSLALSEPEQPSRVLVTDRPGQTGQVPVISETAPKGEVSGSIKVGGMTVQLDGTGEHFKNIVVKSVRWILVLLGMAATAGVGWLIGVLKQLGDGHK